MRKWQLPILTILAATACANDDRYPSSKTTTAPPTVASPARVESAPATVNLAERDAWIERQQKRFDELEGRLRDLEARAATLRPELKADYEQTMTRLRTQRDDLRRRMDTARDVSVGTWKEFSGDVENAFDDAADGTKRLFDRIGDAVEDTRENVQDKM